MWVKKSEWNKVIEERTTLLAGLIRLQAKVAEMERQIDDLNFHHKTNKKDSFCGLGLYRCGVELCTGHYPTTPAIDTETISNLTFEELARYVIDGTPIKRKQEIDVEYG